MTVTKVRTTAAASLAALAILSMSACSSSSDSASSSSSSSSTSTATTSASADPAADLVGSGCEGYAKQVPDGKGSVAGMAQDPVATAASNNPLLTTLTATVSGKYNPGVNLVDTLNGGQFTVIAPTDDAFKKLPAATLEQLKTDAPLLNSILTYHVIPGQLSPSQIVGTHKTVQGGDVTVTGSGADLKFNESALVCGGVKTANAVVYMVDTVMMPPAAAPGAPGAEGGAAPGAGASTAPGGGTGAGAGNGGATATAPGASAGAGNGGATASVPGASAGAGNGGAGVQVPGAGANAGPNGAGACAGSVCVGTGG